MRNRVTLLSLLLLLTALHGQRASAACSAYMGRATINELHKTRANGRDSGGDFIEVKILDTSIPYSTYSDWTLTLQEDGGDGPATFPLSGFDDTTVPWLVQKGMDVAVYINFTTGLNVILKDASGDAIDYMDFDPTDSFTALADPSCSSYPFDTTVDETPSGSSINRLRRRADGTGSWEGIRPQSEDPSENSTNDDVPPNARDVEVDSPSVPAGADAVFTITLSNTYGSDVVVAWQTLDGTATAGSDYTAATGSVTIPAGTTSVTVTLTTSPTASIGESFYLLISSSDAIVMTTLGTATFTAGVNGVREVPTSS